MERKAMRYVTQYKNILSCCFAGFCLKKQCCSRFIMQSISLFLSFQRILSCPTINSTGSTSSAPDTACGVPCRSPGLLLVYTLSFRLIKFIAFESTASHCQHWCMLCASGSSISKLRVWFQVSEPYAIVVPQSQLFTPLCQGIILHWGHLLVPSASTLLAVGQHDCSYV